MGYAFPVSVTAMKPKNAVESLRDIVQDLLVPELRAMKISLEPLREEMKINNEAMRNEMRLRDDKQSQAMQALSDKLGYAIDIRERLAVLKNGVSRT